MSLGVIKHSEIPEQLCSVSTTQVSVETTKSCTSRSFFRRFNGKSKKKEALTLVKVGVPLEHRVLGKKEMQKLVKSLSVNKLGPSLIPFSVPCKFISPFKIFRKLKIQSLGSSMPFHQKTKVAAAEWASMSKDQRAVYIQMSRMAKGEYIELMSGQKLPMFRNKRGRTPKDKTKPMPICNPYRAFCQENKEKFMEEYPELEYQEIANLLEDVWEILDEEAHQHYEELAKQDEWRFIEEWEAWLRQRFASAEPIEPSKFPQPPKRPKNGFRIFSEEKKEKYLELMPESQEHEIAGLVHKEWNHMPLERKQDYEEMAEEGYAKYKAEMAEYMSKAEGRFKKTDEISKHFIQKLRSLQADAVNPDDPKESGDCFVSVAEQTIQQIMNLDKTAVELKKQQLKIYKEEQRKLKNKGKPVKLIQRTINSQFEEINQKLEWERKSYCSEIVKKSIKRGKAPSLIEKWNDEEDFLLTHLSEVIAQQKKQQRQNITTATPVDEALLLAEATQTAIQNYCEQSQMKKDFEGNLRNEMTLDNMTACTSSLGTDTSQAREPVCNDNFERFDVEQDSCFENRIDIADFIDAGEFWENACNQDDEVMIIEPLAQLVQ